VNTSTAFECGVTGRWAAAFISGLDSWNVKSSQLSSGQELTAPGHGAAQ
jgi:hypothetical protein